VNSEARRMGVAVVVLFSAAVVGLASCREPEPPPEAPPEAPAPDPDEGPPVDSGPLPLPRDTTGTGRGCGACSVECQSVGAGSRFGRMVSADPVGLLWLFQSCSPTANGTQCSTPAELRASPYGTAGGFTPLARFNAYGPAQILLPTSPSLAATDEAVYWKPNAWVARGGSEPIPEINVGQASPDTFAMNSTHFFSFASWTGLVRTSRATGTEEVLTRDTVRILALDDSELIVEVTPSSTGARYVARYPLDSTGNVAPAEVLLELPELTRAHAAVLYPSAVLLMIGVPRNFLVSEKGQVVWVRRNGSKTVMLDQAPGVELAAVAHQGGFVVAWANCFTFGDSCVQPPTGGNRGGVYQWQPGSTSFRALCEGTIQARSVASDGTYVYVMTQADLLRLRP
jgi:hypothetical protein